MSPVVVLLIVLGAFVLLVAGSYVGSQRLFAPTSVPDEVLDVHTDDGWRLGLRHYQPKGERRFPLPVVLCHGLSANHYNVDWDPPYGLAQHLASLGHDCFVVSLRGHHGSDRPSRKNGLKWGFGFDEYRNHDVPAVLKKVLEVTGAPRVMWVGHSMGGKLAYALGGTPWEDKLAGLVAIASPSSYADQPYLQKLTKLGRAVAGKTRIRQQFVTRLIAPIAGWFDPPWGELVLAQKSMDGRVVRRICANVLEDISAGVLEQFDDWVHGDNFRSRDHTVNYQDCMRRLRIPVLLVGANKDMLAPPGCMRKAYERIGSEDKTLVMVGREYGSAVDYGHGDVIFGRAAPGEVFPQVSAWLEQQLARYASEAKSGQEPSRRTVAPP